MLNFLRLPLIFFVKNNHVFFQSTDHQFEQVKLLLTLLFSSRRLFSLFIFVLMTFLSTFLENKITKQLFIITHYIIHCFLLPVLKCRKILQKSFSASIRKNYNHNIKPRATTYWQITQNYNIIQNINKRKRQSFKINLVLKRQIPLLKFCLNY